MRKRVFVYLLGIGVGLGLSNSISFAQDFQVTIKELLEIPSQFVDQRVVVEARPMFISTRESPYGEYVLADRYGNWIHVEPWLSIEGPKILPGKKAPGEGKTMVHQVGKWFLITGELKANVEAISGRPKKGISGTHYLIVKSAQELQN